MNLSNMPFFQHLNDFPTVPVPRRTGRQYGQKSECRGTCVTNMGATWLPFDFHPALIRIPSVFKSSNIPLIFPRGIFLEARSVEHLKGRGRAKVWSTGWPSSCHRIHCNSKVAHNERSRTTAAGDTLGIPPRFFVIAIPPGAASGSLLGSRDGKMLHPPRPSIATDLSGRAGSAFVGEELLRSVSSMAQDA
jgi:hypothetical protein